MNNGGLGTKPITESKILIVEGKDEERFFNAYLTFLSITGIQVLPIGGKYRLPGALKALSIDSNFMSKVTVLAIIRDADINATSTFQSVCHALFRANLPVPSSVLQPTGSNPMVIVMIIPPSSTSGELEDICLQVVSSDPAMACVDSYVSCLQSLPSFSIPEKLSKTRVQVFLSSRDEPGKRLGEAAEAGYWPFDSAAFNPLKDFLLSL